MSIDMGNSFQWFWGIQEHVMERTVLCGAAAEVCKVGLASPTKHVAIVSVVRVQSQERLQMEGAIRERRALRIARSNATSGALAAADGLGVVGAHSALAPTPLELGQPEIGRALAHPISAPRGALGANGGQVAQTDQIESAQPPPLVRLRVAQSGRWKSVSGRSSPPGN
jgi:hypothetical protein